MFIHEKEEKFHRFIKSVLDFLKDEGVKELNVDFKDVQSGVIPGEWETLKISISLKK